MGPWPESSHPQEMVLSTRPSRVSFSHGKVEADPLGPRTQDVAIELINIHGLRFHWKQFSLAPKQITLNMEIRAFEPEVVLSSSGSAELLFTAFTVSCPIGSALGPGGSRSGPPFHKTGGFLQLHRSPGWPYPWRLFAVLFH